MSLQNALKYNENLYQSVEQGLKRLQNEEVETYDGPSFALENSSTMKIIMKIKKSTNFLSISLSRHLRLCGQLRLQYK